MPVQFLSEADHERLNRFPDEISKEDHATYFLLSEADLVEMKLSELSTQILADC